jgi:non-reducing end alpha-L-arabinofuranosidase
MRSKLRFRVAFVPLLTALAVARCDYGSDPTAPDPEVPSGAAGTNSPAAGNGGNASTGAGSGGGTGDMMLGGIAGATSSGAGGGTNVTPGAGGSDTVGAGGSENMPAVSMKPCDIYAAASTPCIGAYSRVRALSSTYTGPLYQVRRGAANPTQNTGAGGETQDIGMLANGFADKAAQDAFCGAQPCSVSVLYDQSGQGNNLTVAKAGCYTGTASEDDYESSATDGQVTASGNPVYGLFMRNHEGYRNNAAMNTPTGEAPMGIYEVAAGTALRPQVQTGCCWNFGIASRDNCYGPTGMMNALFFGRAYWGEGAPPGPWFMGDFEAGVWAGGTNGGIGREAELGDFDINMANPSMTMNYAFGILKSAPNNYALRMGDAQQGDLTTAYDGPTPRAMTRWQMEGGIILGIGGDNSNSTGGTFFEGAITAGRPSNETDEAVFRSVQAAGYGR